MYVLVIDDEINILKSIEMYLDGHGIDVIAVENGLTGIQQAEKRIPNLIILDLVLPDIDGYLVCKTLREHPKTSSVPILIMSAKSQDDDIKKALEAGANEYIMKPFEPKEFLTVIKRLLKENEK